MLSKYSNIDTPVLREGVSFVPSLTAAFPVRGVGTLRFLMRFARTLSTIRNAVATVTS